MNAVGQQIPYAWYGDDFTGATDTLATIARRGKRAFLFLSVPSAEHLAAAGSLDAIGIAGAARTMAPDEMLETLPDVGRFFSDHGARIVHYKCCSTFDSAPDIGNLAVAIAALHPFVSDRVVPVIGGQPSLGRYCAFSNLFATAGERTYRIDHHPTMSRHPVTPMTEANLVRHLESLGLPDVAAIHWQSIANGALERTWQSLVATTPRAILIDALDDSHVAAIGALLRHETQRGTMLAVGPSSVAEAWFGASADATSDGTALGDAPVLALVGSLSPVTRTQVAAARSYRVIELRPHEVTGDSARRATAIADAVSTLLHEHSVLISTAPLEGAAPIALMPGLAQASASLADEIVRRSGVRRVAVAGGDTSTAIATALGFWGLDYHGLAARGVTVCRGRSDDPARDGMLLMLKGGQMGDDAIFDRFAGHGGEQDALPRAIAAAT